MSNNYSNSPSMDEILERIKKALSERETKSSYYEESPSPSHTIKEDSHENDELLIKPVIRPTDSYDEVIKPLTKSEKLSHTPQSEEVFVLKKSMKVNQPQSFENVNFDKLYKNISTELGRDLAIAYLSPKIESWLRINMPDLIKHSQN